MPQRGTPNDKAYRNKYNRENRTTYNFAVYHTNEDDKPIADWMSNHQPYTQYLKGLVKTDMNTDRKWQICMGVAIGAWYADKFGWRELKTQLCTLAEELGEEIGLDSAEVHRQAHQVMERERL